ncbi:DUF805 domain-containing protein [Amphibiibacter pelophylacis]|uniref:DUF805 domain-containing protein n=1 Tax=Amphibiibacter pelophylacis TaxID=1799477 RepID=A0ACC6P264_9BURK
MSKASLPIPASVSARGLSADFDESVSPWSVLFSFRGRLDRAHYWSYGTLGLLCLSLSGYALLDIAGMSPVRVDEFMKLFLAWPLFALVVKRCRDRNLSGVWALLALVPLLNVYFLIVELGLRGAHPKAGRFGPPLHRPRW